MLERSMQIKLLEAAAALTDAELIEHLKRLVAHERLATAHLVAHLAEMDARRLYLGEGSSSLATAVSCPQRVRGEAVVGGR